jgi:hypothetical protein
MAQDFERFELMMDPLDLWTVWDNLTDAPGEFGPNVLIGLTKREAMAACDMMNGLHQRRSTNADERAA